MTLVAAALLLAGCTPTPEPSAAPPVEPTPTASVPISAPPLPTLESVLSALDSVANDDRRPTTRLGVVLVASQSQFLEDSRTEPVGPATVRVACSADTGSEVSITLTIGDQDPLEFSSPCGSAPESTTTTELASLDFTAPYRFTVTNESAAVVAIGMIPGEPIEAE